MNRMHDTYKILVVYISVLYLKISNLSNINFT